MTASGYYSTNVTFELPSCVKNDKSRFAIRFPPGMQARVDVKRTGMLVPHDPPLSH